MKRVLLACFLILIFLCASAAGLWAFVRSTDGSVRIFTYFVQKAARVRAVEYGKASGNLVRGLSFEKLSLRFSGGEQIEFSEFRLDPLRKWPPDLRFKATNALIQAPALDELRVAALEGDPGGIVRVTRVTVKGYRYGEEKIAAAAQTAVLDLRDPARPAARLETLTAESAALGEAQAASAVWNSSGTLLIKDLEIAEGRFLPASRLKMQTLRLDLSADPVHVEEIQNGRLRIGSSDPIYFYGSADQGRLNFHIFTRELELRDLIPFFPELAAVRRISGSLQEVHLDVRGTYEKPELSGRFHARKFSYRQFYLRDSAWSAERLTVGQENGEPRVWGRLSVKGGTLTRGETSMNVEPGGVEFEGNPLQPKMELGGVSTIDRTKIRLALRGTPDRPDIRLASDPPYPEEKIAVMLATGRVWEGSEKALEQGQLSLDATKEFLDYFLLGGSGHRLASRFGIKQVSLGVTEEAETLRIKKAVAKKVDIGYGVEKKKTGEKEPPVIAQSVGVDYNASRSTTISVEGKLSGKPAPAAGETADEEASSTDKSVLMKVNRRF